VFARSGQCVVLRTEQLETKDREQDQKVRDQGRGLEDNLRWMPFIKYDSLWVKKWLGQLSNKCSLTLELKLTTNDEEEKNKHLILEH
jgi:hypothetical protein